MLVSVITDSNTSGEPIIVALINADLENIS
jgi:hypothetical protein